MCAHLEAQTSSQASPNCIQARLGLRALVHCESWTLKSCDYKGQALNSRISSVVPHLISATLVDCGPTSPTPCALLRKQSLFRAHLNVIEVITRHLFVDYKTAFDSPIRDIPAKLIRLCRMTLSNSCSSVKVGMDLYEPINTVRGFRQGDPLSCDLFNFVMESVLRKAGVNRNGTIFQKSVQLLAYADDIDIIRRTN